MKTIDTIDQLKKVAFKNANSAFKASAKITTNTKAVYIDCLNMWIGVGDQFIDSNGSQNQYYVGKKGSEFVLMLNF